MGEAVTIVGGGLGGLTLARILQCHGIDVAVYERDESRDVRAQGGSLDLHVDSGQLALQDAGLVEGFRAIVRAGGDALRILDRAGTVLWDESAAPSGSNRPEVDRLMLRDLLLDALAPGTVRWGQNLRRVAPIASSEYRLFFADGTSVTTRLLIGADGAWSRIRPLLTDATPRHAGVDFIELGIPADRARDSTAIVGGGSLFALGDDRGVIAQRNGDGRTRLYVAYRPGKSGFASPADIPAEPAAAKDAIVALFAGWATSITDLIRASDDGMLYRPIHMLPIGLRWPRRPGMTLLGDAAHLMSPFAGEGANLAMLDAAELAACLVAASDPETALAEYEERMFERSAEAASQSAAGLETCIAPDGAQRMAALMRSFQAHASAE